MTEDPAIGVLQKSTLVALNPILIFMWIRYSQMLQTFLASEFVRMLVVVGPTVVFVVLLLSVYPANTFPPEAALTPEIFWLKEALGVCPLVMITASRSPGIRNSKWLRRANRTLRGRETCRLNCLAEMAEYQEIMDLITRSINPPVLIHVLPRALLLEGQLDDLHFANVWSSARLQALLCLLQWARGTCTRACSQGSGRRRTR